MTARKSPGWPHPRQYWHRDNGRVYAISCEYCGRCDWPDYIGNCNGCGAWLHPAATPEREYEVDDCYS